MDKKPNVILKQPLEPSSGENGSVMYDGKMVPAEIYNIRDYNGSRKVALVREPYTREAVKISVVNL